MRQVASPSRDEQAEVADVAAAEARGELGRGRHVVQLPEPVEDLAEAALEPPGPLRRRLLALLAEQAASRGVFPLDEAERLADRVADDEVAAEVAEELVLEGEQVEVGVGVAVGAEERRQV